MRSTYLAKRFREVILDGKLIANTNIKKQISDLTMIHANTQIGTLNTLASLTFHLNYYVHGVLQVFEGGELTIRDKFSFDMEPITSEKDWVRLRNSLFTNAKKFATHIDNMTNKQLDSPFEKEDYGTYHKNIDSMIEHCYYHFGQMVIIRKMILEHE